MNQGSRGSHITKIPKHDLFSSFSYVDHLTSGSMKIESEGPEKHKKSVESSMVNCIDLLRATRKFHLSSLQQKNYTASLKKEND